MIFTIESIIRITIFVCSMSMDGGTHNLRPREHLFLLIYRLNCIVFVYYPFVEFKIKSGCQKWDSNPRPENWTAT